MKGILKKLQENKLAQVLFFTISMLCLIMFYAIAGKMVTRSSLEQKIKNTAITKNDKILTTVELDNTDGNMLLRSWIIRLEAYEVAAYVQLRTLDETYERIYETELVSQEIVNECFGNGWEYPTIGCQVKLNMDELKNDTCYEIILTLFYKEKIETKDGIVFAQERKKFDTEYCIYNGNIYTYNPQEYSTPNVKDEEFQQAIQDGIIRYFDEDGAWLYEYNKKLYWIVDYAIIGVINERPEIPLIIYTNEKNKLPLEMQADERGYIAHYLTNLSYTSNSSEKYYLYSISLDMPYPITFIQTGVYRNAGESSGWKWKVSYRTAYR